MEFGSLAGADFAAVFSVRIDDVVDGRGVVVFKNDLVVLELCELGLVMADVSSDLVPSAKRIVGEFRPFDIDADDVVITTGDTVDDVVTIDETVITLILFRLGLGFGFKLFSDKDRTGGLDATPGFN